MVYLNKIYNSFLLRNVNVLPSDLFVLINRFKNKEAENIAFEFINGVDYCEIKIFGIIPEKSVFDIYINGVLFNQLET